MATPTSTPALPQDWALTSLRSLPESFMLIDDRNTIRLISRAAQSMLDVTASHEGTNANATLGLKPSHLLVDGERSMSWVRDRRVNLLTRDYPIDATTVWKHITISTNVTLRDEQPHRPHAHSEASFAHVESALQSQRYPSDDDRYWSGQRLENVLDRLPTVVALCSKDGKHVYQNQAAFETLGSIRWNMHGLTSWLEAQWGSTHGDGRAFAIEDYPVYKAAVLEQLVDDFETNYEDKCFLFKAFPLYDDKGIHIGGCVFANDISRQKKEGAERERIALMVSDNKFQDVCDNMEQFVWTTDNIGNALYFNRRWYEYTGASVDASLGMHWFDFLHEDDREHAKNTWGMLSPDQDQFITHHRVRHYDGSHRQFLARARRTRDKEGRYSRWLGTSTDITQISVALEEARSSREHLLSIATAADIHFWVVQDIGGVARMTSVICGRSDETLLYGFLAQNDLLRRDLKETLPANLLAKVENILTGTTTTEADEMVVDGQTWRTTLAALRNSSTGVVEAVVGTAINITAEKVKDQALMRAETARHVAIQSSAFQSEFLARCSHEVRTPIHGVLGLSRLLAETTLTVDQRAYLDGIQRSGDVLLVIINDILDFSKLSANKMDIESTPFDLKLVADTVLESSIYGPNKSPDVDLILDYQLPEGLVLQGDSNRVTQILLNLASNALKFTSRGRVTITISEERRHRDSNIDLMIVRFQVVDSGIGIPREILQKLFTPFVQADSSVARRFGGTGLGLSISKALVVALSGDIKLESEGIPGKGSVATCLIPFQVRQPQDLRRPSVQNPAFQVDGGDILLVEDNKINQTIATTMLGKMGFTVRVANNGQEALDILHEDDYNPALVLMDCQMPVLDGYEATKLVRADVIKRVRELPIVAMTASAIRGDREKCLAAGMDDYISKPVKAANLGNVVAKWLKQRHTSRLGALDETAEDDQDMTPIISDVSRFERRVSEVDRREVLDEPGQEESPQVALEKKALVSAALEEIRRKSLSSSANATAPADARSQPQAIATQLSVPTAFGDMAGELAVSPNTLADKSRDAQPTIIDTTAYAAAQSAANGGSSGLVSPGARPTGLGIGLNGSFGAATFTLPQSPPAYRSAPPTPGAGAQSLLANQLAAPPADMARTPSLKRAREASTDASSSDIAAAAAAAGAAAAAVVAASRASAGGSSAQDEHMTD